MDVEQKTVEQLLNSFCGLLRNCSYTVNQLCTSSGLWLPDVVRLSAELSCRKNKISVSPLLPRLPSGPGTPCGPGKPTRQQLQQQIQLNANANQQCCFLIPGGPGGPGETTEQPWNLTDQSKSEDRSNS